MDPAATNSNYESSKMAANVTVNSTEPPARGELPWLILPPLIALVLFTCLANITVMPCIYVEKNLRKANNLYVVSLAVADLMVGSLVMSAMITYTLYGYWPLGAAMCTGWVSLDFTCCTISMMHLCLIAHDRYQALVHPLKYRNPKRKQIIIIQISLAWIVSILVWIPPIIGFRSTGDYPEDDCYYMPNKYYILIQSLLVYYLPIALMTFFYVKCLSGLQKQYKKIHAMGAPALPSVSGNATTAATLKVPTEPEPTSQAITEGESTVAASGRSPTVQKNMSERRRQSHIRSIRTLGVIIVIFLICWLPFCTFWPISAFCPECISLKVYEYSYWSAYINSSINPILYFTCNKDFRSAFKILFCKCQTH